MSKAIARCVFVLCGGDQLELIFVTNISPFLKLCARQYETSQFARVVKGVDLRSTAGNCAWARTPQLTGPPSLHSAACMVHPTLPHLTWQTVHHSSHKRSAARLQTLGRHPGAWRRGATQVVCVQLQSGTEATTASKDPCRTREPRLCCGPTGVPNFASNGWPEGYVSVCPSG